MINYMKYYSVLFSLLLMTMCLGLNGQLHLALVDIHDEYSFDVVATNVSPDYGLISREVSFSSSDHALADYIATYLKYPEIAKANYLEGIVVVRFIVTAEGRVDNPEIIQSVHSILDKEVLDFINTMPDWTPRIRNGRNITSVIEIPVEFSLK